MDARTHQALENYHDTVVELFTAWHDTVRRLIDAVSTQGDEGTRQAMLDEIGVIAVSMTRLYVPFPAVEMHRVLAMTLTSGLDYCLLLSRAIDPVAIDQAASVFSDEMMMLATQRSYLEALIAGSPEAE